MLQPADDAPCRLTRSGRGGRQLARRPLTDLGRGTGGGQRGLVEEHVDDLLIIRLKMSPMHLSGTACRRPCRWRGVALNRDAFIHSLGLLVHAVQWNCVATPDSNLAPTHDLAESCRAGTPTQSAR